jgi:hypothetical protein
MRAADVFIALVNLRGLRKARSLLVDGLRREQSRHVWCQVLEPHRAMVIEQRVESVVTDPCLVPQHVLTRVTDLLQHLAERQPRPRGGGLWSWHAAPSAIDIAIHSSATHAMVKEIIQVISRAIEPHIRR